MRCGSDRRYSEDSKDANAAGARHGMHGHSKQVRHVKKKDGTCLLKSPTDCAVPLK